MVETLSGAVPLYAYGEIGGSRRVKGLGGSDSLRGLDTQRFTDDARFFSNAELRFHLYELLFYRQHIEWQAAAFVDAGRVWSGLDELGLAGQFGRHLVAGHDAIDKAVFQHGFGDLEAVGKGRVGAEELADHILARKADARPGLGHDNVAEHGVAGGDAAVGRIGEDRDIEQAVLRQLFEFGADAGHLHQRISPFVHARPARLADQDQGAAVGAGAVDEAADFFPRRAPHSAGQIARIHHPQRHWVSADAADSGMDRFPTAAFAAPVADFVAVGLEFERVARCDIGVDLCERAVVDEQIDVLLVTYRAVPGALGANPVIAL